MTFQQFKEIAHADTQNLEQEIDKLVYKLYELTEEEIRIIEKQNNIENGSLIEKTTITARLGTLHYSTSGFGTLRYSTSGYLPVAELTEATVYERCIELVEM